MILLATQLLSYHRTCLATVTVMGSICLAPRRVGTETPGPVHSQTSKYATLRLPYSLTLRLYFSVNGDVR